MPQYVLYENYTAKGVVLAQGTILSTDAPENGIFYVSPQDAEKLMQDGLLTEYSPEVLTGARGKEPGWKPIVRRERDEAPGGDFRAPWG